MKILKKGDLARCHMVYSKDNPSEWTGCMALILECLDVDPFINEVDGIFIKSENQKKSYNLNKAINVIYKAVIGRNIVFMNHICFIEEDEFVHWKLAFEISGLMY